MDASLLKPEGSFNLLFKAIFLFIVMGQETYEQTEME